jgi:hypothetical protein
MARALPIYSIELVEYIGIMRPDLPSPNNSDLPAMPRELMQELIQALQSLRYGTIELVVHNGHVVQLERREKVRLHIDVMQAQNSKEESAAATVPRASKGRPDYRKPPTSSRQEIDV